MTNTCTMTFYMVTTEIYLGYISKIMAVAYVVHSGFTLVVATYNACNVKKQAGKLKESLLTWTKASVNGALQREVLSLLLHFNEEAFTFNACGFFKVQSPIFRPMVGVVVTYTLVLYQTKLAALSWSPPPCAMGANSSLTPVH
ncbi:uncharacterized protein LOC142581286 [Dermacentor variabilis]|uniref:uncharacterized protein LOC142581286 n=1 Tax=Dermacentor variabilis TaxID=34621 RepID=UPI003F5C060A